MKIINLTLHELTGEQLQLLKNIAGNDYEIISSPQGKVFRTVDDRIEYANEVVKGLSNKDYVIIGGDTLFFVILTQKIIEENKLVTYLHADTERIRDKNDRFVFNFKGWIQWIV